MDRVLLPVLILMNCYNYYSLIYNNALRQCFEKEMWSIIYRLCGFKTLLLSVKCMWNNKSILKKSRIIAFLDMHVTNPCIRIKLRNDVIT
jgi:hypothetical protein